MELGGPSSSVIILIAAVLWMVYLVPTWFRRREYLSTERNAVRLQQTLRIMAETAELPDQVRAESSARGVASQQKLVQREMQRTEAIRRAQDAAEARTAARQLAQSQPAIAAEVARGSASSRRLRRSRAVSTLVFVAALAGIGFGVAQAVAGLGVVLLAASAVVAVGAGMLLGQLAAVSRTRTQLAQAAASPVRRSTPLQDHAPLPAPAAGAAGWTPVPLPRPLYLSRPEAPRTPQVSFADAAARLARPAAASGARVAGAGLSPELAAALARAGVDPVAPASPRRMPARPAAAVPAATVPAEPAPDHAALLRAASAESEQALREAQARTARLEPREVAEPAAAPATSAAAASGPAASAPAGAARFARMGVIDAAELARPDLDEVLRRRRAV